MAERTLEAFSKDRGSLELLAAAYPHETYTITFEPRLHLADGTYRVQVYALWRLPDPPKEARYARPKR